MDGYDNFQIVPQLRCCKPGREFSAGVCGDGARWQAHPAELPFPLFFCDLHKPPTATAIAEIVTLRRVKLIMEVYFCGVSHAAPASHTEAYDRLETECRRLGAAAGLLQVSSAIGRGKAPAPPRLRTAKADIRR